MPDGSINATSADRDSGSSVRPDRAQILAFVSDAVSETMLREGMSSVSPWFEARRGNVRTAIQALQKMPTPSILIVDVTGEDQALTALHSLAEVVEPDVVVLVIGDRKDMEFYRSVTRNLGALEYLAKPLSRELVGRYFAPLLAGHAPSPDQVSTGRLVTITGVRGGVGATTLATKLAWHVGVEMRRHTVLLDADLHRGTAALMLGVEPGPGLAATLESPERIDSLLAERVALSAGDRLDVLATQLDLAQEAQCAPGAVVTLLNAIRRRYNVIVADVPYISTVLHRDLIAQAQQRVLVLVPTLAAIRDALRHLALHRTLALPQRPAIVLNRLGMPGGLSRTEVEQALGMRVDVVIPDMPRQMNTGMLMGDPSIGGRPMRNAILSLAHEAGLARLSDTAVSEAAPKRRLFRK